MKRSMTWIAPTLMAFTLGAGTGPVSARPGTRARYAAHRTGISFRQGSYFRYALPAGWSAQEDANSVTLTAPDRSAAVSCSVIIGTPGRATPRQALQFIGRVTGQTSGQVVAFRDLPEQPGHWKVGVAQVTQTAAGRRYRGEIYCAVLDGWGQWNGTFTTALATVDRWPREKSWLEQVARSIQITNTTSLGHRDQVRLPGNRPLESVFGDSTANWEARNRAYDRIRVKRQEAMMGVVRMMDPATGQIYDMPHSAYNPGRGGYVNPKRPTELLVRPPAGR
jgi:hypothetical protein